MTREMEPELPYMTFSPAVSTHRDVMNLMEFPFFALQKQPLMEDKVYDDGKVRIEISPSKKGLATIWDKDLLIFIASLVTQRVNDGDRVARVIRFQAVDFFRFCKRSPGGRAYQDFEDAMFRLQGTQIRTNIALKDGRRFKSFDSWLKMARYVEEDTGKLGPVEVELNDWVWSQIVDDRTILSIDEGYYGLTSALQRRLYEIGRKHCGNQPGWTIAFTRLAEKLGYEPEDRDGRAYLKRTIAKVVEQDTLPEYQVFLAKLGDASNQPVDVAEFKSARDAFKTTKLVYLRREARKLDNRRRLLPASPKPEPIEVEESMDMATAADFRGLLDQMTGRLSVKGDD